MYRSTECFHNLFGEYVEKLNRLQTARKAKHITRNELGSSSDIHETSNIAFPIVSGNPVIEQTSRQMF